MLGVSFTNPNYEPFYEGKIRHVENLLECFTTEKAREQLCIYYSGFKFGNLRMGLSKAGLECTNSYFWEMSSFYETYLLFKKNLLTDIEIPGKTFNQKDAILKISNQNTHFRLSITNEIEYEICFSKDRFEYLLERISLGYMQYLMAKLRIEETLSESEMSIVTTYKLPVIAFKEAATEIFKYHKGTDARPFFELRDLRVCTNYFKLCKVLVYIGMQSFSLDFSKFCLISKDIHSGRYFKMFGRTNAPLFSATGGTHAERSKREDGCPTARSFHVLSGSNEDELIFKIEVGKGKYDSKKAITMAKIEYAEAITLSRKECLNLCNRYEKVLMGYLIEQYLRDENIDANKQVINQIDKINAKTTFIASVARAFNMKKIRFDFAQYNNGFKQEKYIDLYMTEQDFNMLYQKTFSGEIAAKVNLYKKEGKSFSSAFSTTCGTSSEMSLRSDHKASCKTLQITLSTAADCTLLACKGSGKQDEDKKYIMEKVEERIYVPITYDNLKSFLLVTMFYWKAYKIAQTIALEKLQKKADSHVA